MPDKKYQKYYMFRLNVSSLTLPPENITTILIEKFKQLHKFDAKYRGTYYRLHLENYSSLPAETFAYKIHVFRFVLYKLKTLKTSVLEESEESIEEKSAIIDNAIQWKGIVYLFLIGNERIGFYTNKHKTLKPFEFSQILARILRHESIFGRYIFNSLVIDINPIPSEKIFFEKIKEMENITRVTTVLKLPNPEYPDIVQEMKEHGIITFNSMQYGKNIRIPKSEDDFKKDSIFGKLIHAILRGYGRLTVEGRTSNKEKRTFSSKNEVETTQIPADDDEKSRVKKFIAKCFEFLSKNHKIDN